MAKYITFALPALLATASARPWTERSDDAAPTYISDWAEIKPSPDLVWQPCFDDPQLVCARLEVPLDYEDASAGTTSVAYIKYIATNDTSAPDVIFNPGGPGESGVVFAESASRRAQVLGAIGSGYNLVSFDPRGVQRSGQGLTCFPGAEEARNKITLKGLGLNLPLGEVFQNRRAAGEHCTKSNLDSEARYSGTVANVHDLAHFIDLDHALKGLDGEAQLYYYGVSYGTLLGQTFAALFPDKIGRMMLEGNVHGAEYYTGLSPSDVRSTDDAFSSFFQYCHNAGPERCAFYNTSTTPFSSTF